MRKKTFFLLSLAVVLLVTAACGGSQGRKTVEWEDLIGTTVRDTTVYGICMDGTAMNSLQLLTDNGDTILLDLVLAKENDRVFGGMAVGDRMAVLVNTDSTKAVMVLNQTTLMGPWVMPNPMDGSSEMGIFIKDGGVAESIDMGALIYESWRMNNGMLEIKSTRDDGANFEEVNRYGIFLLTADSLVLKDSEDTYEYRRPRGEEDYSDLDIELDDGSDDELIM